MAPYLALLAQSAEYIERPPFAVGGLCQIGDRDMAVKMRLAGVVIAMSAARVDEVAGFLDPHSAILFDARLGGLFFGISHHLFFSAQVRVDQPLVAIRDRHDRYRLGRRYDKFCAVAPVWIVGADQFRQSAVGNNGEFAAQNFLDGFAASTSLQPESFGAGPTPLRTLVIFVIELGFTAGDVARHSSG